MAKGIFSHLGRGSGCILNVVYLKGNKRFETLDVQIELMANHRKRSKVPN